MLESCPRTNLQLQEAKREGNALFLKLQGGIEKVIPVSDRTVRVLYTEKEKFSDSEKPGILDSQDDVSWEYSEDSENLYLHMNELVVEIHKKTNRFRYFDKNNRLLLAERNGNSKELEEFAVYELAGDQFVKEYVDTADGKKEVIKEAARVQVGTSYHTRLYLNWDEDEALYGLGQHEEGYGSLRGNKVYLHQANRKIAVPLLVSTKGYGLLMHTYSPAIFNDTIEGSYFYTESDPEMDYFFINGSGMDQTIAEYRKLTGKAVLLPKWAYGYIQSQERYETAEEILRIADEYRERGLGLDCLVLDWISWPDGMWGQKSFDFGRFPDPKQMTDALHAKNVHFMISIWPNCGEGTENNKEFAENHLLLPGCDIYNALSEIGRQMYWKQTEEGLFKYGIDAWWCDSSEPFTPEWNHKNRVESSKMYEEFCETAGYHLPAELRNAFGLYHAKCLYEGQRGSRYEAAREKRVVNLTRSGYIGQQKYGTVLWSGDTAASWDTYRRQIAAGIHFCASGLPYWTVDIGAFFVKPGIQWFWDGKYADGEKDPAYCELYTRWFQWGAFLPVFRAHGTDVRREMWKFDHKEVPFYDALKKANQMRYELIPYIYSQAGKIWLQDDSMMKPLAFLFTEDRTVWDIRNQYMFGDSLMICPVTKPMYYTESGEKICEQDFCVAVYLPEGAGWYDYYTNAYYPGGQWIEVEAPIDKIPVFVREGSIIPTTDFTGSVNKKDNRLKWKIYTGKDAYYSFYEDEGDGYGYEQGQYTLTEYVWSEKEKKLTVNGDIVMPTENLIIELIGGKY